MKTTAEAAVRWRRWRHGWDVIVILVDRDLKALYKRSILGVGWAVASPLLQLLVFSLVFRRVLSVQVENYTSFAFCGLLVWGWFQSALSQSTGLITSSQALVRQPGFPLALLPFVTVAVRFIHYAIALPILFVFMGIQGIRPGVAWLALPVVAAVQFVLTTGLAYPLAALNVRLRDTQHVVNVVLQLVMFLTPIFYSVEAVPAKYRPWFDLNPLTVLLDAWRGVLLYNRWPAAGPLALLGLIAVLLLWVGERLFVSQSYHFVDEL